LNSFGRFFEGNSFSDALDLKVSHIDEVPVRIVLAVGYNLRLDPVEVGRKLGFNPFASCKKKEGVLKLFLQ
jgi:hypothetical protein